MSDPLSIIASVAAVSTAALQSAQILLQLIDGIKNAPEEIAAVSNDTHAFYDIVFSLETSLKDDDIVRVVRENNTIQKNLYAIARQRWWYFKKKDIKESLDRLGQNNATLNAALNTISAFCQLRLMASTGREPDDWSSVVNECGSMGTDVGFALNRFVQGTVTLAFADPPPLTSDIETQSETMVEDTAPDLGSDGWTALHLATEAEAEDVVQTLLTHGVEVNAKTIPYDPCGPKSGGITALHIASCRGDERITQLLIDNGADVIARSAAQVSPLEEAIKHSSVDVVRILIQNGATEDISPCGWTPLHEVASSTKVGSIEIAADRLEMVRLLLNHGEDVEARTHGTRKTPLTVAAIAGHVEMAQLLLDRGADLTAQARCGLTVLHFAASYGHVQMVQWLLDAGTEMEVTDYRGVTALQLAALQGKTTIIELLLERGADVTARNNRGHNALSMARQQSQHTAIKTLERYYGQHSMEVPEFAGITTPDAVYWIDL